MDRIVQIVVRLHHVHKRVRLALVEVIYSTNYTAVASRRIGYGVVLDKAGTHTYVDVLAYLCPFPHLVYPKRSRSLSCSIIDHIGLRIEIELLLTCNLVEGLDLENLPLGLPPYPDDTNIACNVIRKKVGTKTTCKLCEGIVDIRHIAAFEKDTVLPYEAPRVNKRISLVIVTRRTNRAIAAELWNIIREPLYLLRSKFIVEGIHDPSPRPVVLVYDNIGILYVIGIAVAEDTEFHRIEPRKIRLASYYSALVDLHARRKGVHESVVEGLLEILFLGVMPQKLVGTHLTNVLPVVIEELLSFLHLLLSLLLVYAGVLNHVLYELEILLLLVLLYL